MKEKVTRLSGWRSEVSWKFRQPKIAQIVERIQLDSENIEEKELKDLRFVSMGKAPALSKPS